MAKKSDKISSKAPTAKIKTKKSKSHKVRRRHDSISDEDGSRSLSSEEDRRKRRKVRSRSHGRKDVKGSRKRSRKRSYSSDSTEESPEPRKKKRKTVKKTKSGSRKKKVRRAARTSSESRSCSTCEGEGVVGGDDEIESKRDRVRDEKPMSEEIDRDKFESGPERSGYRFRSRSLCKDDSESGFQSQERVTAVGNGKRLRSVIVVPKGFNEGGQKEEMTYDHDDYPSYRSNDSEDGEIKEELDNHLQVAEEVHVSDAQVQRLPSNDNFSDDENKNSAEISSLKDEDLETVLRLKAIENLKRFKGNPQKIAVICDKEDKKQPSGEEAEADQTEPPKVDVDRIEVVKPSEKDISENDLTRSVEGTNGSPARDPICLPETSKKELIKKNGREETISAKQGVDNPTSHETVTGSSEMVSTTTVADNSNITIPKSRSLSTHPILKRALASLQPPQDKIPVTVCNTGIGIAESVARSSNIDDLDISNDSSSTGPEPTGENKSDLQQNEGKDDSQFEQKTMSVMRGSEMVQVSYKVYIPKRTPALARRQLKR